MAHGTHEAGNGKPQKNIPAGTIKGSIGHAPYAVKPSSPLGKGQFTGAGEHPYAKKGGK